MRTNITRQNQTQTHQVRLGLGFFLCERGLQRFYILAIALQEQWAVWENYLSLVGELHGMLRGCGTRMHFACQLWITVRVWFRAKVVELAIRC